MLGKWSICFYIMWWTNIHTNTRTHTHAHSCTHLFFYLPSSLVLCSGFLYYTALSVWLWFSEHGDSFSLKLSFVTQHFTTPGTWNVLKRKCQIQVSFKQKDIQHLETDKVIFQIHVLILTLMTGVQYSRGLKASLFGEWNRRWQAGYILPWDYHDVFKWQKICRHGWDMVWLILKRQHHLLPFLHILEQIWVTQTLCVNVSTTFYTK